jgi:uncharacterized membrane protein YfcA
VELTVGAALGVAGFGLLVGALSALLGVGGGLVMVPFIVLVLQVSQQAAEGTSLMVILPTAAIGVVAHARRGFVSFSAAGFLAVGGVLGSYVGAWIALGLHGTRLRVIFGVFICVMGIRLLSQGLSARRDSPSGNR